MLAIAVAALAVSPSSAVASDDGHAHHRTTPFEKLCLKTIRQAPTSPQLGQAVGRTDHDHSATLDVVLVTPSSLSRLSVVSCVFVDADKNSVPSDGEPIRAKLIRPHVEDATEIRFVRHIAADPSSPVCVLSVALSDGQVLASGLTCVVNPSASVPEAPIAVLLGLSGVGTFGFVAWRRRRRVALTV
jgi:hypothetical protein